MSLENYLMFLQQVITMTDPHDVVSKTLAKMSLESVMAMATKSGMTRCAAKGRTTAQSRVRSRMLLNPSNWR